MLVRKQAKKKLKDNSCGIGLSGLGFNSGPRSWWHHGAEYLAFSDTG